MQPHCVYSFHVERFRSQPFPRVAHAQIAGGEGVDEPEPEEFADKRERILCFLEADRGTMPVERAQHDASSIARKLYAYAMTWKTGIHRSRFGISRVRVLTVTTSESRCESIRSASFSVSGGHGIFLQSYIALGVATETYLDPVWRSITDARTSILD